MPFHLHPDTRHLHWPRWLIGGIVFCIGFVVCGSDAVMGQAERKGQPKEPASGKSPLKQLIADLDSADGTVRVAATREIFRRGKNALAGLKEAGAKQIAPAGGTINTRRLDMVYSLIEGLPLTTPTQAGYTTDSFGLHAAPGTTAEDVAAMGKKHGFTVVGTFRADARPNCYVRLPNDEALPNVLRRLLVEEAAGQDSQLELLRVENNSPRMAGAALVSREGGIYTRG